MTIAAIDRPEAVRRLCSSLHLRDCGGRLSVPMIAQALRRAAHILAPCPRHALERAVCKSLIGLGAAEELESLVEETAEALLVYGDILEMRPLENDSWRESPTVLRPAPPSFVARPDGSVIVVGIAGDDITPFAGETETRLEYRGPLRMLAPGPQEDLAITFKELGLIELSENAWLRLPPIEPANAYVAKWKNDLAACAFHQVNIAGLRVLTAGRDNGLHRDRWSEPATSLAGMHVARRPQKYGKDIWCLVDLEAGAPVRVLDLHSRGDRLRPCDIAWRIQMAIDDEADNPQRFRVRTGQTGSFVDFFAPLPSWAARKLTITGQRAEAHRSLLSFAIPNPDLAAETEFLRQRLWLQPEQTRPGGETP